MTFETGDRVAAVCQLWLERWIWIERGTRGTVLRKVLYQATLMRKHEMRIEVQFDTGEVKKVAPHLLSHIPALAQLAEEAE